MQFQNDAAQFKQTLNTVNYPTTQSTMVKAAVFLLVLVAVVNSYEEGNFPAAGDEGEGNFLSAGDEGEAVFIADSVDGDYFTVTRDVLYDPISAKETELPTRLARSSLNVGSICPTCRLLSTNNPSVTPIAGTVRIQNVTFFRAGSRISAVRAIPFVGSASADPQIVAGGLNRDTVTVRFTSRPGEGFTYRMEVWGQ